MGSGRGWMAGDWPSTAGVLNITAVAWTAGFHWWRSGNITRTQTVSEYMLVLALCLVHCFEYVLWQVFWRVNHVQLKITEDRRTAGGIETAGNCLLLLLMLRSAAVSDCFRLFCR